MRDRPTMKYEFFELEKGGGEAKWHSKVVQRGGTWLQGLVSWFEYFFLTVMARSNVFFSTLEEKISARYRDHVYLYFHTFSILW